MKVRGYFLFVILVVIGFSFAHLNHDVVKTQNRKRTEVKMFDIGKLLGEKKLSSWKDSFLKRRINSTYGELRKYGRWKDINVSLGDLEVGNVSRSDLKFHDEVLERVYREIEERGYVGNITEIIRNGPERLRSCPKTNETGYFVENCSKETVYNKSLRWLYQSSIYLLNTGSVKSVMARDIYYTQAPEENVNAMVSEFIGISSTFTSFGKIVGTLQSLSSSYLDRCKFPGRNLTFEERLKKCNRKLLEKFEVEKRYVPTGETRGFGNCSKYLPIIMEREKYGKLYGDLERTENPILKFILRRKLEASGLCQERTKNYVQRNISSECTKSDSLGSYQLSMERTIAVHSYFTSCMRKEMDNEMRKVGERFNETKME